MRCNKNIAMVIALPIAKAQSESSKKDIKLKINKSRLKPQGLGGRKLLH